MTRGLTSPGRFWVGLVSLMTVCPGCEAEIEIDEYDVDKGEIISCPECGIELEVVGLSPVGLAVASQGEVAWEE